MTEQFDGEDVDEADHEAIRDAVEAALSESLRSHEGTSVLLQRWTLVVDYSNAEGVEFAYRVSNDGAGPADRLGLLEYAKMRELANMIRVDMEEDR